MPKTDLQGICPPEFSVSHKPVKFLMSPAPPLTLSVMITTRNRLEDLKRTCRKIKTLVPAPLELLITADGCTDGTVEFVRAELPDARLLINAAGQGSVASRDRMMRAAKGDLVLSLDDDSYPEEVDCVAKIAKLFGERPRLAVAHFPQHSDEYPETLAQTDFGAPCLTRSFANSGACLRRSIYLQLPGFEPRFFHAFEEPDYALQCTAEGYEVYYSPILVIRHHYSGQSRNRMRTHHRHARNQVWSMLMRCPFPVSLLIILGKTFNQFRFAWGEGLDWVIREPVWWWQALGGISFCLRHRRPCSWAGYRKWQRLPNRT
jgi:GT2 family glycosyltransferase